MPLSRSESSDPPISFNARRLATYVFAALACAFAAFHAFGYTQILRFNEDISFRQYVQWHDLLTAWFKHLVSPLYATAIFLDQFVPIVGPFSHVVPFLIFLLTVAAFCVAILIISDRDGLAVALALMLVFSSASITEGSYWIHASHGLLSVGVFFATYACILKFQEAGRDRYFLAACALNLVFFTTSSVAYLAAVLLAGFLLATAWRSPSRMLAALVSTAGIVAFLGYRNFILTGSAWTFSTPLTGYNQAGFRNWYVNAVEVLEYAHPLGLAARALPQLYITPSNATPLAFLHLIPLTVVSVYALRLYGLRLVPVFLYAAGVFVTLLNAGGLAQRHYLGLTLVSCFVLALAAARLLSILSLRWKFAAAGALAVLAMFNFVMKAQTETANWWKFFGAERKMVAIASEYGSSVPLVFLTHDVFALRNEKPQWSGNYYATTAGMRRILADLKISACIYKGYEPGQASDHEALELGLHNSAAATWEYAMYRISNGFDPTTCPEQPQGAPRCFAFDAHAGLRGGYHAYAGAAVVPACDEAAVPGGPRTCRSVMLICAPPR